MNANILSVTPEPPLIFIFIVTAIGLLTREVPALRDIPPIALLFIALLVAFAFLIL
jgi:hypothetical protein